MVRVKKPPAAIDNLNMGDRLPRLRCGFGRHLRAITLASAVVVASPLVVSIASGPAQAVTSCRGVQLHPGANLQNSIDAHGQSTTFCLADGNYTTRATIAPKDGDRFIGVYTDGTRPNIANTGSGGVFKWGKNTFYRGLGIGPSKGIGLDPGTGSTIIGNRIHDNQMCGIETAANYLTIARNKIVKNGTLATKGNACGVKLHGYLGADSGAYNTVTNNIVRGNTGHGLWVDCDGHNNTFSGNNVYNNAGVALDDETSYNNTFTNNNVHGNGFGWSDYAVSILDSIGTKVRGNKFTNNYKGVSISRDARATRRRAAPGLGCADRTHTAYYPFGITITSNRFTTPERSGFASSGLVPASAARFNYNCWTVASLSDTSWRIPTDSTATWSQWRGIGQDPHGRAKRAPC